MTKKFRQKFKYLEKEKSFQDELKTFVIIFKGLLLKQIKQTFFEGESPTLTYFCLNHNLQELAQVRDLLHINTLEMVIFAICHSLV